MRSGEALSLRAPAAADVARAVAARLADQAVLDAAVAASRAQTTFPASVGRRGHTVANGYAGTALLFAAVDARWPDEGWDRVGHRHLTAACTAMRASRVTSPSLFGGLAGVGFAAITLAAGRDRYQRLLASVDGALLPKVVRAARRVDAASGCGVSEFDVISGLAGIGAYLLGRRHDPAVARVLPVLVGSLTRLLGDAGEPRRWHTPAHLVGEAMRGSYPHGAHNCGLAHGLPGPLALLAIALREGAGVDGTAEAVDTAARWLVEHRVEHGLGPDWPNAVGLPGASVTPVPAGRANGGAPARAAWCYGSPGVARALWLAGEVLGEAEYRDLAVRTMRAVLARPRERRGITSPTFCHGTAGLAQVTTRFAGDTGLPEFATAADGLAAELLDAYEPDSLLGYRNIEPGGIRVDQPGLLDGAPGIALALLAAGTPVEPAWDRLFLLS